MLFALLLVAAGSCAALFAALLAGLGLIVLLVGVFFLGGLATLGTLGGRLIVIIVLIVIVAFLVVFLDHLKVVLKSKGDELVLELVSKFEVFVHELSNVLLFFAALFIIFLLLGGLATGELLLVGHLSGLEEVEKTLLLNSLCDGLTWLTLLGLLLLLDLLLCDILAVLPVDLSTLALLNHVLVLGHHE